MMCWHSFLISSDSYLVRTYGFMDETPWIAEEQLVMTMEKAQETKLNNKIQKLAFQYFLLTSAKAKKFQDGNQLTRLYTAISL